ncbi:MAG: CPBP family intramembrane glutamic endopeptidase [Betaproteobacteria bacterium]
MHPEWLVLFVILLALSLDGLVVWPNFTRRVAVDAAKTRRTLWAQWMLILWGGSALVIALWIAKGVSLSEVDLALPSGWRLWAPVVLIVAVVCAEGHGAARISRLSGDKPKLRAQIGSTALVMPHDASELPVWLGLSASAGFCEELLFRGFLIWILQPVAGWWIAAIASLAVFAAAHAYQGAAGMVRSATLGALFTVLVAVTHSLWPGIVLHAAMDWMGGLTGWLILRDVPAGEVADGAR